ncbi:hypothetical protein FJTKL_04448 [Diaporthe vaccinii]|uniref:Rhodopsin domain-containing protein n=1 Tax=Diaporthe vaccinii TaxID=105482 RepID=A0ABR4DT48_9PEZI
MSLADGNPSTRPASVITKPLVVVSVVFPFLAAVSIYLRLMAKRRIRQPYHADDWWVIATWFLTFPMSVLFWVFAAKSGVDYYHIDSLQGTYASLEVAFLTACILQLPLSSVKISVLLFYKRIFTISEKLSVCIWIAIGVIVAWCIVFTGLLITLFDPISESWHGARMRYDLTTMGLAQVGSSFALDVLVLCFPLPIVFSMLLSPRKKFMVFFMFWLGAFCCVAAVIRLILLVGTLDGFVQAQEKIYRQSTQYIFMLIEPNCSIIAACLPCYGPFMAKTRDRIAKSNPNSDLTTSESYTRSRASTKGAWPGSMYDGSFSTRAGSQVQLHLPYRGPVESHYHVRCFGGKSA